MTPFKDSICCHAPREEVKFVVSAGACALASCP
jgi:hypothetical protein